MKVYFPVKRNQEINGFTVRSLLSEPNIFSIVRCTGLTFLKVDDIDFDQIELLSKEKLPNLIKLELREKSFRSSLADIFSIDNNHSESS